MGKQLTDVVETANASTSANSTFFPLVTTGQRTPGRHPPWGRWQKRRNPPGPGRPGGTNLLRHLPL